MSNKPREHKNKDLYDFLVDSELAHYYTDFTTKLKVTTVGQIKDVEEEDLTDIGMAKPEQRRLKRCYQKEYPKGTFRKIKKILGGKEKGGSRTPLPMTLSVYETSKFGRHIIPNEALSIHKEIGRGEFGIVQQGVWTNEEGERIQVAIKCLSKDKLLAGQADFLKEATIMHSLDQEHLVRLYGVVLDVENSLMLVTELAPLRSLSECLKEHSLRSYFPVIQLCDFAVQIASGMRYLHSKNVIHRDLATRNILVFSKDCVKISDFGLSRALGVGKDYYQTNFNVNLKLPLAWCAPESINYLKFTSCSDIWGFGVTCWEMFSYGFQPWAALTGSQILQAIDAPNFQRLEKPDCCPEQYHQIMQSCWEHDPKRRPSFVELCEELPKARPMQMKALTDFAAPSAEFLSYKENDVISVLAMRTSHNGLWKGVIGSGRTGLFNSNNTVAYDPAAPSNIQHQEQQQLKQQQQIAKAKIYKKAEKPRSPSKMGKKRHVTRDMIGRPQGDIQHLVHIGIEEGESFGDVTFLQEKYHQLPQKVQTVLDQADVTPTSPLKRTLTLPAEYIKSRTPDLIAVPIQIPRHGSQSSLPESDPSRCPSNLYIDKTETKKTEKSTTHESAATAKPASYFDFDDSTKASNKTDVHEMVTMIDDDLTPPRTPCPDSPTDSLSLHFDLGPSLLDDVLSAWDFSKSTLDSNFGSSSTGSPPKDSKFNSPSTESPRKDSKFNFPSSGSPPKRESSFKLDSPPKSNNPQKTVDTSVLSKSLSPEVIPKHVVNPIKKPKRSFRTERPKKNYIKQLKESPLSSPEVEIVSLPGKDERNKTGDIIERASSISTSTSLKTDVIVDSAVAKDVTSSLEFDKFRKRDSDTESTDRDYLQLMESTSGHAESLPVESVPKPAESTSGLAESFETKERQSSCDISDDNLNETPVFQRSLSKKDAISDRGLEAYEALVGSSVNVKKSSKAPSSQSRVVSPSKGIPVIRSVSQRGSVSPSHAPNSWSSSQSGTVSPSHAPYIRSSSHTDAVSPSYAPNSWGSSLSGVSSPTANSVFSVSRQSSITSPTKSECDLQYADLLHDTSGEDTIDLSQPVSTEPALSPTSPSNSFYAVATTTEERRDPVSSTTCRTSVGRNKNASSVVGNFYAQIYEKPEAASSQRKASSSEEDLDRDDASRRSARDIIKRFENKSQPLSVKMESHSPKKQAISNLKDLFTIDTNNEQKPPDKEPAPPVLSPRKISLPTRLNTADNLEQDDDKLEVALSETTLKHLQRSTRRTRRPIGEARCKRRSSGDASESGTDSREEVATLAYGDKERRKKEQQQKYARQKSTEEVMKTRPLPDLPVDVDKNPSHVMHDYEMISIPAVPPRMPLNPQWPKKRRSRKSSKSQSGKSSPTKSSSSASSLLYSESDPGTPDTPVSSQSASSPFLSTSPITNSELRTKFLHQKSASLDITSDSDVVRSSPEEIRRHLKKDKENYQNIKSNQKTLSLDRKVLTRSHTNPSLQNMDSKSEFRTRSQTTTDIHGQSLQVVNDGVPKRCKSYEDELDDILDGALGPAESLNDVLKRTYKLKDGQDISSSHSEVSSVTSTGSAEKLSVNNEVKKDTDEGYMDMTGKHSSKALNNMEWADNCKEVQEVKSALKDEVSILEIVRALKCNNWEVELSVQDIKVRQLMDQHLGDDRRCRQILVRYNWVVTKAQKYLINNPSRQSDL